MMAPRSGADAVHMLTAAVSAIVGGTLAVAVLQFFDIQQPNALAGMALILVVAAVIAIVAHLALARTPPGRPMAGSPAAEYPKSPSQPYHWGSAAPYAGPADANGAARLQGQRAQTGDGVPVRASTPTWWTTSPPRGTASPPPTPPLPVDRAAVEQLSASHQYAGVKRVVQCPECGHFGIDITHRPPVFDFVCRRCAHKWTWRRGTAWPRTMIRPRRGKQRAIAPAPHQG